WLVVAWSAAFSHAMTACGGDSAGQPRSGAGGTSTSSDASGPSDAATGDADGNGMDTTGRPCSSNADCGSDSFACLYPLTGGCPAASVCLRVDPIPGHCIAVPLCCCDGTEFS